jgi:hypothetical protein
MGNVFRRLGLVSLALVLGGACGDAASEDEANDGPPPYQGSASALPALAMTPQQNGDPAPSDTLQPSGSEPPSSEAPAAGSDTPLAPAMQMTPQAPSAETPPAETPPSETPPPETSPAEMPPATIPPADEPPADEPDEPPAAPRTQAFILFGQSNMWGVPNPQAQDLEINPRVEVLTLTSCGRHGMNQWVPAQPPLHSCVGQPGNGGQGPGVGPGDYFAKTLADAFPQDTILLVPNAIPGVSIDVFQPGQQAYNSMLGRARMAQERGEIRGIIFHQGETDNGQDSWPNRVKTVVDRLRADLGIASAPFVAGELFYGAFMGHNARVNQLPSIITNAGVARAEGFTAVPREQDTFGNLHFDLPSQREFGRRYGQAMLDLLEP